MLVDPLHLKCDCLSFFSETCFCLIFVKVSFNNLLVVWDKLNDGQINLTSSSSTLACGKVSNN